MREWSTQLTGCESSIENWSSRVVQWGRNKKVPKGANVEPSYGPKHADACQVIGRDTGYEGQTAIQAVVLR